MTPSKSRNAIVTPDRMRPAQTSLLDAGEVSITDGIGFYSLIGLGAHHPWKAKAVDKHPQLEYPELLLGSACGAARFLPSDRRPLLPPAVAGFRASPRSLSALSPRSGYHPAPMNIRPPTSSSVSEDLGAPSSGHMLGDRLAFAPTHGFGATVDR